MFPRRVLQPLRRLMEGGRRWKLKVSAANRRAMPPLPRVIGRSRPIAVIGAGLAGLSAAYLLKRAGHQVSVYGARNRPGGRVLTLRDPFADGLYAEAGAGRIADVHRSTLYWVKHFGLKLEPMYPAAGQLIVEDRRGHIRGG